MQPKNRLVRDSVPGLTGSWRLEAGDWLLLTCKLPILVPPTIQWTFTHFLSGWPLALFQQCELQKRLYFPPSLPSEYV